MKKKFKIYIVTAAAVFMAMGVAPKAAEGRFLGSDTDTTDEISSDLGEEENNNGMPSGSEENNTSEAPFDSEEKENDTVAPELYPLGESFHMSYGEEGYGNEVDGVYYYNESVVFAFEIEEDNFYEEDISIRIDKDGEESEYKDVSWGETEEGRYATSIVLLEEGAYTLHIEYTDRAGNEMIPYTSEMIIIDKTKPELEISYSGAEPKNMLLDEEGYARLYYDSELTVAIRITEKNFDPAMADIKILAEDAAGNTLETAELVAVSEWSSKEEEYVLNLVFGGDAVYTFEFSCTDMARNVSDVKQERFTIDMTPPSALKLSYSPYVSESEVGGVTCLFYDSYATVTVYASDDISGVYGFLYRWTETEGSSAEAEEEQRFISASEVTYSNGGTTASFSVPAEQAGNELEFSGRLYVSAVDKSGNKSSEYTDGKRIVVDNVLPSLSVEIEESVRTEADKSYYNGTAKVLICIEEENFFKEDVRLEVLKDEEDCSLEVVWTVEDKGLNVGAFELYEDGVYTIKVGYADRSLNAASDYISDFIVVDTTISEPRIMVNGEAADGRAFNGELVLELEFEDENFDDYEISFCRTGLETGREDITKKYIIGIETDEKGGRGSFDTFSYDRNTDGIYELELTVYDKAGNSASSKACFTINRFGSVYIYGDYLLSLIENGGAYVQSVDEDLVVFEYNADKLLESSFEIVISKDGRPLREVIYTLSSSVDSGVEGEWHMYKYTISKENFSSDGVYKISVSSSDAAGNNTESSLTEEGEILFRVDGTAPKITSITGLESDIIEASEAVVNFNVYDTIGLASVTVYVNGEIVQEIMDFSKDENNFKGSFVLEESPEQQSIRIVARDKAGNETDTASEDFKLSAAFSFYDRVTVFANTIVEAVAALNENISTPVVAGIFSALAAGFTGFTVFMLRRKRKG